MRTREQLIKRIEDLQNEIAREAELIEQGIYSSVHHIEEHHENYMILDNLEMELHEMESEIYNIEYRMHVLQNLQSKIGKRFGFISQITGECHTLLSFSTADGIPCTIKESCGKIKRAYLTDYYLG